MHIKIDVILNSLACVVRYATLSDHNTSHRKDRTLKVGGSNVCGKWSIMDKAALMAVV